MSPSLEVELNPRTVALLYRAFGGGSSTSFSTIAVRTRASRMEFFALDDTSSIIAHVSFSPHGELRRDVPLEAVFPAGPLKKALSVASGLLTQDGRTLAVQFARRSATLEVRSDRKVMLRRTVAQEAAPIVMENPLKPAPKEGTVTRLEDCRELRVGYEAVRDVAEDGVIELSAKKNELVIHALPRPEATFYTCAASTTGQPVRRRLSTLALDLVVAVSSDADQDALSIVFPLSAGPILARYKQADGEVSFLLARPAEV